jgi:hypothetical protein
MPRKILRKSSTISPVPRPPRRVAKTSKSDEPTRLSGEGKRAQSAPESVRRAPYSQLIVDARAAAPDGEGSLITFIAPPRHGKTTVMRFFIDNATDRGELVLAHDPKIPAQFDGIEVPEATFPALMATALPVDGTDNPVRRFGYDVDPDDVIALGLDCARGGCFSDGDSETDAPGIKTTVVIDEGRHLIPRRQSWSGDAAPRAYCEGSSQGLSLLFGTQIPQRLPLECFDYSQAIVLGRCAKRTLPYMEQKMGLDPELSEILPNLKPGEFVLLTAGSDWNGLIYFTQK